MTVSAAENTAEKERRSEGSRSRAHQVRTELGSPRNQGPSANHAKAGALASIEAPPDQVTRQSFGEAGRRGSYLLVRKPRRVVIRESSDPWGARVVGRLHTLGRRIFPAGRSEPQGEPSSTG